MYLRYTIWQQTAAVRELTRAGWVNEFTIGTPCIDARFTLPGYGWKPNTDDQNIPILYQGEYRCYYRVNGSGDPWTLFCRATVERAPSDDANVYQSIIADTGVLPEAIYDIRIEANRAQEYEAWGGVIEGIEKGKTLYSDLWIRADMPLQVNVVENAQAQDVLDLARDLIYVSISENILGLDILENYNIGHQVQATESIVNVAEYRSLYFHTFRSIYDIIYTAENVTMWHPLHRLADALETIAVGEVLLQMAVTPHYFYFWQEVQVAEWVDFGYALLSIGMRQEDIQATEYKSVVLDQLRLNIYETITHLEQFLGKVVYIEIEFAKEVMQALEAFEIERTELIFSDPCSDLGYWDTYAGPNCSVTISGGAAKLYLPVQSNPDNGWAIMRRNIGYALPEQFIIEFELNDSGSASEYNGGTAVMFAGMAQFSNYTRKGFQFMLGHDSRYVACGGYQNGAYALGEWNKYKVKVICPRQYCPADSNWSKQGVIVYVYKNDVLINTSFLQYLGASDTQFADYADTIPLADGDIAIAQRGGPVTAAQTTYVRNIKIWKWGYMGALPPIIWETIYDSVAITESRTLSRYQVLYTIAPIQNVTVTEAVTIAVVARPYGSALGTDLIGHTEYAAVAKSVIDNLTAVDTAGILESVALIRHYYIAVNDAIAATESIAMLKFNNLEFDLYDTIAVAENVATIRTPLLSIAGDDVATSEYVAGVPWEYVYDKIGTDDIAIAEYVDGIITLPANVYELVAIAEDRTLDKYFIPWTDEMTSLAAWTLASAGSPTWEINPAGQMHTRVNALGDMAYPKVANGTAGLLATEKFVLTIRMNIKGDSTSSSDTIFYLSATNYVASWTIEFRNSGRIVMAGGSTLLTGVWAENTWYTWKFVIYMAPGDSKRYDIYRDDELLLQQTEAGALTPAHTYPYTEIAYFQRAFSGNGMTTNYESWIDYVTLQSLTEHKDIHRYKNENIQIGEVPTMFKFNELQPDVVQTIGVSEARTIQRVAA